MMKAYTTSPTSRRGFSRPRKVKKKIGRVGSSLSNVRSCVMIEKYVWTHSSPRRTSATLLSDFFLFKTSHMKFDACVADLSLASRASERRSGRRAHFASTDEIVLLTEGLSPGRADVEHLFVGIDEYLGSFSYREKSSYLQSKVLAVNKESSLDSTRVTNIETHLTD
jgi:hypothetical protein